MEAPPYLVRRYTRMYTFPAIFSHSQVSLGVSDANMQNTNKEQKQTTVETHTEADSNEALFEM